MEVLESKRVGSRWQERIMKLSIPVGLILLCVGLSFFLPSTKEQAGGASAQLGILALVITKTIFASCGFTFAYLIKEISFPFLSLQELLIKHHWPGVAFLAAWYVICVYCFSLGG
jgi:hypothetical protein